MRRLAGLAGLLVLAGAWAGLPLVESGYGFTGRMTMHLAVVAVAAPLIALGVTGTRLDPLPLAPAIFAAVPAAIVELVVVWAWHAPILHTATVLSPAALVLEQASFLMAGLLLWLSVLGGLRQERIAAGVVGLLLTSMHMTLLGTLLTLAPRPLYPPGLCLAAPGLSPLEDQQLGGILMLAVGGAVYLIGGLALMARLLGGNDPVEETMPASMRGRERK